MSERNFVHPDEVDAFGFDWGRLALTCGPAINGASRFSAGHVHLPPGQGHARHNHPGAEEIILVLEGEGEQMVEDADGEPVTQVVRAGCTVFVPEGRFHATRNAGTAPMRLFVVYSPAGPEELLRSLPDFRLIPAGDAAP